MKRDIVHVLKGLLQGEVRSDELSRNMYSIDASIYEISPLCIVIPKHEQDVLETLKIAKDYSVPIISRGAGTGIAGGCLGTGIIIDFSKYMHKIIDYNLDEKWAICEPGVVQNQFNNFFEPYGLRLGPDTSTGNRATIGGMIGNNSSGAHSLLYGRMVDHILETKVRLLDGTVLETKSLSEESWIKKMHQEGREGKIYKKIHELVSGNKSLIKEKFPNIPKHVSGYNLDEFIKPFPWNVSALIAGSEGSLGVLTETKVKLCSLPQSTALCAIHFYDMMEALEYTELLLSFNPYSLEFIDNKIIQMARMSPKMEGKLSWLKGNPEGLMVVEFEGSKEEVKNKINHLETYISQHKIGYVHSSVFGKEMDYVWLLRKSGLGLLLSRSSFSRAIGFLEDISVPPHKLASFVKIFTEILKREKKSAGIYGHAGAGCLHIRPYIDLRDPQEVSLAKSLMLEVSDILLDLGGSISAEHGDGLVRTWLNKKMFGTEIYNLFIEVKEVFDPLGLANPGKVVKGYSFDENLKLSPSSKLITPQTFMSFEKEGGFALSIDLCNGNGECRKNEGLMCPSYQVTKDEKHLTRGRAQSIRGIIHGSVSPEKLSSKELKDVLDLCLECKGCKKECPSQVDMAKVKSELLYQFQEKHGYSLRSRLFAYTPLINKYLSKAPSLMNNFMDLPLSQFLLDKIGVEKERSFPYLAKQRFSSWYNQHKEAFQGKDKTIVLFNDSFNEYNCPEVGQSATQLLHASGYNVIVPSWCCCGRTFISKGFLKQAKYLALNLIKQLYPYVKKGYPIIGLEPSCLLTLTDEIPTLIPGKESESIARNSILFEEWWAENGQILGSLSSQQEVLIHSHCHQKALVGESFIPSVMKKVKACSYEILPTGCCGMAGSFGYEKEHYDLSLKIAKRDLVEKINRRQGNEWMIANGFSCRHQIKHHFPELKVMHMAEFLLKTL